MTAAMIDLGRRAVACTCWRWMPGMAGTNADGPFRVDAVDDGVPCKLAVCQWTGNRITLDIRCGPVPDLSDPATVGCVVALLRERWPNFYLAPPTRDPEDKALRFFGGWAGLWPQPEGPVYVIVCGEGASEAEALVASLEHADRLAALEST